MQAIRDLNTHMRFVSFALQVTGRHYQFAHHRLFWYASDDVRFPCNHQMRRLIAQSHGGSACICQVLAADVQFPSRDRCMGLNLRDLRTLVCDCQRPVVCSAYLVESECPTYIQDKRPVKTGSKIVGHDAGSFRQPFQHTHGPGLPDIE